MAPLPFRKRAHSRGPVCRFAIAAKSSSVSSATKNPPHEIAVGSCRSLIPSASRVGRIKVDRRCLPLGLPGRLGRLTGRHVDRLREPVLRRRLASCHLGVDDPRAQRGRSPQSRSSPPRPGPSHRCGPRRAGIRLALEAPRRSSDTQSGNQRRNRVPLSQRRSAIQLAVIVIAASASAWSGVSTW